MKQIQCVKCRFFDTGEFEGDDQGYCRRRSPTTVSRNFNAGVDESLETVFPVVSASMDWCGDWAKAPDNWKQVLRE